MSLREQPRIPGNDDSILVFSDECCCVWACFGPLSHCKVPHFSKLYFASKPPHMCCKLPFRAFPRTGLFTPVSGVECAASWGVGLLARRRAVWGMGCCMGHGRTKGYGIDLLNAVSKLVSCTFYWANAFTMKTDLAFRGDIRILELAAKQGWLLFVQDSATTLALGFLTDLFKSTQT